MTKNILTRGDMDGLTSSVILTEMHDIDDIRFAHPKDVQDGLVPVDEDDIVVNFPYVDGCHMWFDHHASEERTLEDIGQFDGAFELKDSCARVIYDYYDEPDFGDWFPAMLEATDKIDAARLTMQEVEHPEGWILLAMTLDPRSGLGPQFKKYFRWLVEYVKELPIEKVLEHKEVKKRADRVIEEQEDSKRVLNEHSERDENVIVTDLRDIDLRDVPAGNRFLIYTLYPDANVEARIMWGKDKQNTVVAIGHSIFNQTCDVHVGNLCKEYGGGGHEGAGTVQLENETADEKIREIIERLKDES